MLKAVQSPGQYIGGEWNSVVKDHRKVSLTFALAFPDTYSVGMSHLGIQILYYLLNREPDIAAERVFAPRMDFEEALRARGHKLFSLETRKALREFDVIGFSLQYELCLTNVLRMLELSGIPLFSRDRSDDDPIIVAGGPGTFSPEPLAEFIDIFFIGDAEGNLIPFARRLIELKRADLPRKEILFELATSIEGLYVPAFYDVSYKSDGRVSCIEPIRAVPRKVEACMVNLETAPFPDAPIVPYVETIHDRIAIEIMRGCAGGCRFCQAGSTKGPVRFRSVETILQLARAIYRNTGYDEISLLSLSSSNYPALLELVAKLNAEFSARGVSISLPSLRVDEKAGRIPALVSAVRKAGLTLAPEAATSRLQRVIRKRMSEQTFFAALEEAYRRGWEHLKLYFMVGLPTETLGDVEAIGRMILRASNLRRKISRRPARLNVTISPFVPKAFTPFQWEPMAEPSYLREARSLLRRILPRGRIRLKFHSLEMALLEGLFSRGDRRLCRLLLEAYSLGCRFDAWKEHFDFTKWTEAFRRCAVDPAFYTGRRRALDEVLPWSHISAGVPEERLRREYERALKEASSQEP